MIRLVLLRILETYFRHRWLYALPLVIMLAAGAAYFLNKKPIYTAEGVLYVQADTLLSTLTSVRPDDFSWVTPAQATSSEIGELLQTDAFVRSVIQHTELEKDMDQGSVMVDETIDGVRELLSTWPLGESQILVVAEHEDPTIAYELVEALINSYLQWRVNTDVEDSVVAISFLTNLIDTYETDLNSARELLKNYLEVHPEPLRGQRPPAEQLEVQRLQAAVDLASTRYANALDRQEDAQLTLAQAESEVRQSYYLIDSPRIPTKPKLSKREMAMNFAVFVAMGFLLSALCVAGGVLLDRTIRFPIDVSHGFNLPVVAVVPLIDAKERSSEHVTEASKDVKLLADYSGENAAAKQGAA